ncbi:MAG: tripartite tricarboxylate transporter substrate binding protein, partial [Variovorax sp.]
MTPSEHFSRRLCLQVAAAAALGLGGLPAALAQDRITRIVVAFPPGGPVDFVART